MIRMRKSIKSNALCGAVRCDAVCGAARYSAARRAAALRRAVACSVAPYGTARRSAGRRGASIIYKFAHVFLFFLFFFVFSCLLVWHIVYTRASVWKKYGSTRTQKACDNVAQ